MTPQAPELPGHCGHCSGGATLSLHTVAHFTLKSLLKTRSQADARPWARPRRTRSPAGTRYLDASREMAPQRLRGTLGPFQGVALLPTLSSDSREPGPSVGLT